MVIEIIKNTTLKPSPSSSNPSPNTYVPLTIFDRAQFDLHIVTLHAFRPPMPSNEAMKDGLSRVLCYFPHLAGRLTVDSQNRPSIILSGAGIRLIETRVPMSLDELLPLDPSSSSLRELHPPWNDGVKELLQVQLNRFSCGGVVIGQTSQHLVADGQSMNSFFLAWAKSVRGFYVNPIPYHDRATISVPRKPPKCEFDHREKEFREKPSPPIFHTATPSSSIEKLSVHLSAEFVSKLKKKVNDDNYGQCYSTFECVLVHIWKKITLARGLKEDEYTEVKVAVNGRARMNPPVPMEYFGNLVLWAYPRLRVKDLLNESHSFVAKAIHEAVAQIDDRYFKSFIDFGGLCVGEEGEKLMATPPVTGISLSPNVEVDSWLRFQFHDLDFGGGGPCAFLPLSLPVEGWVFFALSCEEKGGIDVFMSLLRDHVDLFKRICFGLD